MLFVAIWIGYVAWHRYLPSFDLRIYMIMVAAALSTAVPELSDWIPAGKDWTRSPF